MDTNRPSDGDYLRLLLDCSAEPFYAVDREGRTTLANRAFLEMLGFGDEAEAMGRQLHDIVHHSHPDGSHYPAAECPIYICARDGTPAHVTGEHFFRLDGTRLDVEYWAHPVRRDGVLQGAVCTFTDVTERNRVEGRLQAAERFNTLILASSRDCIVVLDLDGITQVVSPGGIEAMEISDVDAIIGLSWLRVWDGEDHAAATAAVAIARSGGTGRFQGFCATHRGTPKWWDVVVSPLADPAGIGGLVVAARDITAQRAAETALRETEEWRRLSVEAADIGTWWVDPRTHDLHWDDRCRALFGIAPGTAVNYDTYLSGIHPDDFDRVTTTTRAAIDPAGSGAYRVEYRTIASDGEERWIAAAGRSQFEDGRAVRMVGTVRDVTAQHRARERSRLLSDELQHRIKNTLALVQAVVRQTLRSAATPADAQRVIDARLASLGRAHELLTTARWEGSDLRGLVGTALASHDDAAIGRFFICGPDVWLPPEAAMPVAMMFHELATNAAKYGALSVPDGRVSITWEAGPAEGADRPFSLVWRESGGPPVGEPKARGFGSKLIEGGLGSALGRAAVKLTFAKDGVVFTIRGRVQASEVPTTSSAIKSDDAPS